MSCQDCVRHVATADQLQAQLIAERVLVEEMKEKLELYEAQMAEVLTELRQRREAAEYGPHP